MKEKLDLKWKYNTKKKKILFLRVLGLQDGEISLNKIEKAYRIKRQQLSDLENTNSQNSQILFDEIEKNFSKLVNYLDDDSLQDQEEVVI